MYAYAGNNPVRYIDPDGKFSISIGWTSSCGAGAQAGITKGVVFAFSKKYGMTFGKFSSTSIGSQMGWGTSTGLKISLDVDAERVETGVSKAMDIGGSIPVPGTPISVGGEVSVDLETDNLSISPSGTFGPSSPELHVTYSTVQTENASDSFNKALSDYNSQLENMYLDYCLDAYEMMED